jgi:hypothetical protein
MKRLSHEGQEVFGRRDPVGYSADRYTSSFDLLPVSDESDPKGALESFVKDLGKEIQVAN